LGKRGIDTKRIIISPRVDHVPHLARHNLADLMIDTFPLGGGMTAVDTFHMGVPLVSLTADRRPAVQQTKALINLIGPEAGFAAHTEQEYIDYAKAKYAAGKRTKTQRKTLRHLAINSLFFDYDRYTRMMRAMIAATASAAPEKMIHISADYQVSKKV
jgi:predicted O-linked N-acetylglucosamine transferase (SPINDLY family)